MLKVTFCKEWNNIVFYDLCFPLVELGNALAICGWSLWNRIDDAQKTPEVHDEFHRLRALEYLDLPDSREWLGKFGTLIKPDRRRLP